MHLILSNKIIAYVDVKILLPDLKVSHNTSPNTNSKKILKQNVWDQLHQETV
jgi:hypothetical protein